MAEILVIDNGTVKVGQDDGSMLNLPIASLHFTNPAIGDKVRVYQEGADIIVKRDEATANSTAAYDPNLRSVNKVVYIVLTFFFAGLGVQRFMRGQVGLGILMLLIGWWATLGIWPLIDFIISLTKLSSYPGDDYVFTADGRFTK